MELVVPSRQTCRRSNVGHISLGFQPTIPVTFDIKKFVLSGLKEKSFNEKEIIDPRKHLSKFYET